MAIAQAGFAESFAEKETTLSRLGIAQPLAWGFLGLLLSMIGDGVESGYLSPFLAEQGLAQSSVAWIFTTYGLAVGLRDGSPGLFPTFGDHGVLSSAGLFSWVFFEVLFLTVGLRSGHTFLILLTYGAART